MSGHKQWSEIRHKSKVLDKDQVRGALERYRNAETLGEAGYFTTDVLAAVARAFVEGNLIPAEVDYEAARQHARAHFAAATLDAALDVLADNVDELRMLMLAGDPYGVVEETINALRSPTSNKGDGE